MAAFLANVGVNAAHSARSPLFADGSFRLLAIPEIGPWAPPMVRPADVLSLADHYPRAWRYRPVHLDPDLAAGNPTYGDNCRWAGRAFSLRRAQPGDVIVYLARLHPVAGPPGFHLVGRLEIVDALEDLTSDPGPGWWDGNAHVRRARARGSWDSFWVFRGSERSCFLPAARRFSRPDAEALLGPILWRAGRTDLQTIGSHTRSVRRLTGPPEARLRATAGIG